MKRVGVDAFTWVADRKVYIEIGEMQARLPGSESLASM